MAYTRVSAAEFAALGELADWRYMLAGLHADFRAGSFPAAASLVAAISEAAEAADHHPDIDVRYPDRVRVSLTTLAVGGTTTHDVDLARKISEIAVEVGAAAEPTVPQKVEIAIDTLDPDRIRPFWAAVLGYRDLDGYLIDPLRIGPPVWFQRMDEPRTDRDRFHLDISVPHDVADERIVTALAAGGTLVTDRFARSWWVLADADGNEACICTWQDR
ncbi:MAG: Pterin-4-alpha-carbinolamine dehydratase [uncultured Acidimicrobiales bacterium]|uniref:Putative pterin-4-alpha-carbinolamine dehydratase n=1 Tax=uncultured Acidimicrobiales bacterium TaxID=310071 RepID=A0A6J4HAU7_9ACTN|nr:MAG: Pterin-4-alpha-carbinolamine dehydratase [uncultured Acidimicrobiales bacterium]